MIYRPTRERNVEDLKASAREMLQNTGHEEISLSSLSSSDYSELKELVNFLIEELHKLPGIKEIRGRGLMIGIEFEESIKEVRSKLLFEEKVFTGVAGTNTIRLLPPLCLTMDEAKEFLTRFKKVLNA